MMPDYPARGHRIKSRSGSVPLFSPQELTGRASGQIVELGDSGLRLHQAAVGAFNALAAAAAADGIRLSGTSGFRDFGHQLAIWNGKFRGQRPVLDREGQPIDVSRLGPAERVRAILMWSALPGASRHHWGTEVDVVDLAALTEGRRFQLLPSEYAARGLFARLGEWLAERCSSFGFFRPYDIDRGGVQPEPWHLSYAPLSGHALEGLTLEVLTQTLQAAAIDGREAIISQLPEIHRRYVRGVAAPSTLALAAPAVTGVAAGGLNRAARPS
jgi:LAS superfamily LD-carboxypeptidase LdcB